MYAADYHTPTQAGVKRKEQSPPSSISPPHQKAKIDDMATNGKCDLFIVDVEPPLTAQSLPSALVAALTDPTVMAALAAVINSAVSSKIDSLNSLVQSKEKKINELDTEVTNLKTQVRHLTNHTDNLVQYERRNYLRIYTNKEEKDYESTDTLVIEHADDLGVEISPQEISRSHRIGKRDKGNKKPRPIIVKFVSYRTRERLFEKRKEAVGFFISEDLTKVRDDIYYKARQERKNGTFKHVWCRDGRIKVRFHDDKVHTVTTLLELDALVDSV
jgi:hypothetical protein